MKAMFPKTLNLIGRIFLGIPYLFFGLAHIVKPYDFVEQLPSWLPGGIFWDYLFGAIMCACALSVMTGKWGMNGSLVLACLLLIFMAGIQIPHWLSDDPDISRRGLEGTFKSLGLIGGLLGFAAYFANKRVNSA